MTLPSDPHLHLEFSCLSHAVAETSPQSSLVRIWPTFTGPSRTSLRFPTWRHLQEGCSPDAAAYRSAYPAMWLRPTVPKLYDTMNFSVR